MAGLRESGNEPPCSPKASYKYKRLTMTDYYSIEVTHYLELSHSRMELVSVDGMLDNVDVTKGSRQPHAGVESGGSLSHLRLLRISREEEGY
ncbi:hypothetical protein ANN_02366 [Periplaneta americana]|uniref:Uncharacterized protein n=1 Tax=Periplaneta americana TaxID=6978 RepID=A0ABQ8TYK0_PERAM|nr:hypothetical protein ANN_02366 [Periplaneta americana]